MGPYILSNRVVIELSKWCRYCCCCCCCWSCCCWYGGISMDQLYTSRCCRWWGREQKNEICRKWRIMIFPFFRQFSTDQFDFRDDRYQFHFSSKSYVAASRVLNCLAFWKHLHGFIDIYENQTKYFQDNKENTYVCCMWQLHEKQTKLVLSF